LLITAGSLIMVAIFVVVWRRHASLFIATMTIGALAWTAGNVQWLGGAPIFRVVFWWLAFLVLTIAGERLELNRLLRPTPVVRWEFVLAVAAVLGGVAAATWWPEPGVRALGVGLIALTSWLARHDVARRTVHQRGLTRFMAVSLLAGYAWLGVGGAIAAVTGAAMPGVRYDALLHAVFVGFVMSMVFAHAPHYFSSGPRRAAPVPPVVLSARRRPARVVDRAGRRRSGRCARALARLGRPAQRPSAATVHGQDGPFDGPGRNAWRIHLKCRARPRLRR
jgi:hypothetical protein